MTTAEVDKIIGGRYRLNSKLGGGGMGVVYHATDRLNGDNVALKQVQINAPNSVKINNNRIDYRLALAHEFRTMASLRHPHIISVLDYGFDDNDQPYYTMELLTSAQPLTLAIQTLSLSEKTNYLVQLLQALAYLHRRGVYHRDLKPDNVIIDTEGVLRVLDFGLALVHDQTDPAQNATGTLAYMAPETLKGYPPTPATDLYAVGIMGYEIFAGQHPFNLRDVQVLIEDVIDTVPSFDGVEAGVDVMMVLERLMLKNPEERFQSANEVIDKLAQLSDVPILHDTPAIRESFLQAAQFVGRDFELGQLSERLEQAIKGQGQAILVAGESGVGKSRLLDELRTLALVGGADVIRGQGITEVSSPYAIWRDTLRWLALITPLSDLEASVLKPLIPDIEHLIGREVTDAPELSPQAMQARIISLTESLFERLPKDKPILIILEDVHWAGSESLKLLEHLAVHIVDTPVMIVASYRNDEYPTLPDMLNLPVITLKQLSHEEILMLSTSMLGDAGQQEQVVDLLEQETNGNLFYLIEVVRTLAEETGSLESIGNQTIPGYVFDGGLQSIIKRRLDRVPTQMRQLMGLCAIHGRQIDMKLVTTLNDHLPHLQRIDVDEWLETLSDVAILNVIDNHWQFAHDKLRENLTSNLNVSSERDYHRRVAEAITSVYGSAPEYTVSLAYHWRKAGDTNKELAYVTQAGEQMLANGAYQEAVDFFKRALNIAGSSKLTPLKRAALLRKLSAAYVAIGNLAEGGDVLRKSLDIYGYPAPTKGEINQQLLRQLTRQIVHRILPFVFIGRNQNRHEELLEAAAAHEQLVELSYYTNDSLTGLYASLRTMNISELTQPSPYLGRAYGAVSYVSMLTHNRIAEVYYRKGLKAAYDYGDGLSIARTHQVSALRFVSRGNWTQAETELQKALDIYEELGDLRFWTSGAQTLGEVYYFRGEFQRSIDIRKGVYQTAMRYGDTQAQGFGLRGQAMNLLILGDLDSAEQYAQAAVSRYSASHDQIGEADSWGLMALVNLRQERDRRALVNAEQVIDFVRDRPPTSYNSIIAYYATAETLLTLYERDDADTAKLTPLIGTLLQGFKRYSRRFLIGTPRYHLYQGRWHWLNNRQRQALKMWDKGLKVSEKLEMPYDTALLQLEIGTRPTDSSQKQTLLDSALQTFQTLGASLDVDRTKVMFD